MSAYMKGVVAVVGAVVMAIAAAWTDDKITNPEWVQVAIAGFTAFQVYITANLGLPLWSYSKSITAAALGGLGLLAGYLANGQKMAGSLWLNVAIAAFVAAGVWLAPNEPAPAPVPRPVR